MPIVVAIIINSGLIFSIFHFVGFDFYLKLFDDIELIPLFLGITYLGASHFMGGIVRATCGLSLIVMSAAQLGISESKQSIVEAVVAVVAALTPL